MTNSEVRVRIAPSPTGFFHIGSARTALYNWLFTRHHKGKFILRIEDTDVTRSSRDMIKVILDGLTWLGLDWDEGPYFQSQRLDIYRAYAQKLITKGLAYYCYCSSEELNKEKQLAYKKKIDWKYDRRCLHLSPQERTQKERQKIPKAVRLLVPDKTVVFKDLVHKEIKKEAQDIEDFVIMRHNATPTYNLACVVDDYEMAITHVIRAVEHIANTPKQLLLYEALELPKPEFAHLPLILGDDKKKLSKRHGAVSLMSYKDQGFLPEAMVNYLSLLGWSPGGNREIMKLQEIISAFNLERVNPANAVFDFKKLEWLNNQYIMNLTDEELAEQLKPYVINFGLLSEEQLVQKREWFLKVINLMKPRLHILSDINKIGRFFFREDYEYEKKSLEKHFKPLTIEKIKRFLPVLSSLPVFTAPEIEQALRDFTSAAGLEPREMIHPLRVFITGKEGGPGLFETIALLGKGVCIKRINNVLAKYEERFNS